MKPERKPSATSDISLMGLLASRYLPYWPLYVLLCGLFLAGAFVATKYLVPVYRINATLVINDKAKGVEESETLRSLNVYAANKTVENEVQVLKSRTLMGAVVQNLNLYASVFEIGRITAASAYLTSPVRVLVQDPAALVPQKQVDFAYDPQKQQVSLDGQLYGLGQWHRTPYGVLRFEKNPKQKGTADRALYFSLVDPKRVTDGMLANLEVGASSKLSSVVTVQYTDEVPERGEDVVNALLDVYNRAAMVNNNQLASNTLVFVKDRVRIVGRELDSIQRRIQQFKSSQNVVDISQQGQLFLQNVADNDRKIAEINTQLAVLDKVDDYIQGGSKTGIVPTTLGISDPVLADLLQKVNDLELRQANLSTSSGPNHPLTKAVESEIQQIRPSIRNVVGGQRARLAASRGTLADASGQYNAVLRTLPGKERQLLEISRQQAIKSDVYAFLLKRKEEAELSSASNIADSRIVDRAESSVTPVASKRLLVLLGALVAGLALSTAYVFVKEETGGKINFRSTLDKATGIPVAGEISSQRRRLLRKAPAASVVAGQFEQLQAALGFYDSTERRQAILVTSALPNEGKTFVSTQLAESLAAAGYKTVLLDLNHHAPEATRAYGLSSERGAATYLRGAAPLPELVQATPVAGLGLLAAGAIQGPSAALFVSSAMEQLFEQLRHSYDFIVVDTPPVELAIDAYLVGRWCDVSLLVVRQGATPAAIVQHLDDNHKLRALPGLAIVFNDVKPRGFLTSYTGYGYGYGYQKVYIGRSFPTRSKAAVNQLPKGVPAT